MLVHFPSFLNLKNDRPVMVKLTVVKQDGETLETTLQGGAPLDGATYEATYTYDGATKTVEGTTGGSQIVLDGISLGKITVKETSAPERHLPDVKTHEFAVIADMADQIIAALELTSAYGCGNSNSIKTRKEGAAFLRYGLQRLQACARRDRRWDSRQVSAR